MQVSEAINRGYNFFVVATLGILGGSLISELTQEPEPLFKLDELLIIAIGAVAVIWYLVGRNRTARSWIPLLLAILAFASKIFGLIVEFGDKIEVGDDIGMVQMLLLLVIVAAVAYVLAGRQIRRASAEASVSPATTQSPRLAGRGD